MQIIVKGFFRLIDFLIVLNLVGMVVLVFTNVVLRYGFNSGIMMSEELSRFMLVWLTFIGGAAAMHSHSHLGVDSFVRLLPPILKKFCAVLSIILTLICVGYFFHGSLLQTKVNMEVRSPIINMPMSFYYGVGIFFSLFAAAVLVNDLYHTLKK